MATHQKATSQEGDSRPRNDSSSMPSEALQQSRFTETIGDGHQTDNTSNAMNAMDAARRLASIDIEPLSDHAHLIDLAIVTQRRRDLAGVRAAGGDERRLTHFVGIDITNALELPRKL